MMDPLNYRTQVSGIFRRHGWDYALTDAYAQETGEALRNLFQGHVRETRPNRDSSQRPREF